MTTSLDEAADRLRAVRLSHDERAQLWAWGQGVGRQSGDTGWAPAAQKRTGLPLVRLLGRGMVDSGGPGRRLGGSLEVECLVLALRGKTTAEATAFVAECRDRSRRLARAREVALAAKFTALADVAEAAVATEETR